jgi:hypothetical protein
MAERRGCPRCSRPSGKRRHEWASGEAEEKEMNCDEVKVSHFLCLVWLSESNLPLLPDSRQLGSLTISKSTKNHGRSFRSWFCSIFGTIWYSCSKTLNWIDAIDWLYLIEMKSLLLTILRNGLRVLLCFCLCGVRDKRIGSTIHSASRMHASSFASNQTFWWCREWNIYINILKNCVVFNAQENLWVGTKVLSWIQKLCCVRKQWEQRKVAAPIEFLKQLDSLSAPRTGYNPVQTKQEQSVKRLGEWKEPATLWQHWWSPAVHVVVLIRWVVVNGVHYLWRLSLHRASTNLLSSSWGLNPFPLLPKM